ncbi:MAG: type II secretion system protein [Opitutales bacterium]|nr:type II secretion system protein [Opitutales bacterium]
MKCSGAKIHTSHRGFMLIEVLVALALFGMAAVFLVDGISVASRTMRLMKDTREMEQDLLWARSQIFKEHRYEKLEDGGEIEALTIGEILWETEIEMTNVLDLYRVKLSLEYDGNEELGIDSGTRVSSMLILRPGWANESDFSTERTRLLEDKRDKIRNMKEERQRK